VKPLLPNLSPTALLIVGLAALAAPAWAEKADRSKPLVVEADRSGVVDYQRQVLVYSGNAVISQGSMVLRAERIEMREMPDGYRAASATGVPGKPATWRQRRDGVDETVEGSADRIEFDGRADTLRFLGNGAVRRLRGATVADEITGSTIVWDNVAEVFKVEGGSTSAVNPTGRVRAVLSPRADAAPADAPASAAAPVRAAPATLQPSRALEDRR
jgi:lipopolysaccharide export system protein LptA